ncbi:HotDog domain-containing protein [Cercophora newfieldiana]|uniref:HotDog domain-containing protein n=1 Tax=Cercophora newfieldiana TaxID=92897 RepID=A0AA39YPG0_9PEZI|nr:HotDog domain-containing protein [Cercophora newfieldiana]
MAARISHRRVLRLAIQGQLSAPSAPIRILHPTRSQPLSAIPPRCLRRAFSTSPTRRQDPKEQTPQQPPPQQPEPVSSPPPPPASPEPPRARKTPRFTASRLLSAAAFLLFGTLAGSSLRLLIQPPSPPEPGTEDDRYTIEVLHSQAAKIPLVQQLSADPAWDSWDAYNTLTPEHRAQHIMAGTLSGSRGVGGYQRVFYNAATGEFVSVVYFGAAITGWPGVVHGGALATLLDESCGRAAFWQWGGKSGVTATLKLEYKKATLANGFYVLRVRSRSDEELPESERGKRHYKSFVDATIEDAATGAVTVTAEALFVGGVGKKNDKKGALPPLPTAEENMRF